MVYDDDMLYKLTFTLDYITKTQKYSERATLPSQ